MELDKINFIMHIISGLIMLSSLTTYIASHIIYINPVEVNRILIYGIIAAYTWSKSER